MPSAPSVVTPDTAKFSWSVEAVVLVRDKFSPAAKVRSTSTVNVTVVPSSEMVESPIAWEPVNLDNLLVVPPVVVTPVPDPAQLPAATRQTSPEELGRV